MSEFGKMLRAYREKCVPRLTQARLGELAGGYSGAAVSEWEHGQSKLDADNRHVLVAVLKALQQHGGFTRVEAADRLLAAGNYRALDDGERRSATPRSRGYSSGGRLRRVERDGGKREFSDSERWPLGRPLSLACLSTA